MFQTHSLPSHWRKKGRNLSSSVPGMELDRTSTGQISVVGSSVIGCGGLQCTEPASLVLPFRFELTKQVAA
jgi:hypothetical protein